MPFLLPGILPVVPFNSIVKLLAPTLTTVGTATLVLSVADGCIVGSSLKVDGHTWNPVDPDRAAEFMRLARAARGS